jgi:hypothetical protein
VNNLENGNVSGADADTTMYGQFLSWLTLRVRTKAPLVKIGVWFNAKRGGGKTSAATERQVLAAITDIDWIGADFYTTSSHASATEQLIGVWGGSNDYGWITGSSDYARLGSPPLAAPEFGCSKEYASTNLRTDAQIATYYNAVRSTMVTVGVCVAVMFCRDSGPAGNYDITPGQNDTNLDYPLARAALSNQIANPV